MKRAVAFALGAVACTAASGAGALTVQGSDRLVTMVNNLLPFCQGTAGVVYSSTTSTSAEAAMLAGTQLIAPMERFMGSAICSSPYTATAQSTVVALDAALFMGNLNQAGTCAGGLKRSGSFATAGGTYTVADWRDVLKILFAGVHNDGSVDCNSAARSALAQAYSKMFEGACGASCSSVQHVFRPADGSDTTDLLLSMLGLPSTTAKPNVFCNGTHAEDKDPIRRACLNEEQVCSRKHDLGLVLPIVVNDSLSLTQAYPTSACTGLMAWGSAPRKPGSGYDRCPNGDMSVFISQCLVPANAVGVQYVPCLATQAQRPMFVFDNTPVDGLAPANADGRVYNLHLRKNGGDYLPGVGTSGFTYAYHRIHSTTAIGTGAPCTFVDPARQIGCLTQASPCSLGVGGYQAQAAGAMAVSIDAVAPTVVNVQHSVWATPPIYPLSREIAIGTIRGFDYVGNTSPSEGALEKCLVNGMPSAATNAGFVPLGVNPYCTDFDEQAVCGAPTNVNACGGIPINWCPAFSNFSIIPLQIQVGYSVDLIADAFDPDNGPSPLGYSWGVSWTSTGGTVGTIGNSTAKTTTFTCTAAGQATVSITVTDGMCPKTQYGSPITCSLP